VETGVSIAFFRRPAASILVAVSKCTLEASYLSIRNLTVLDFLNSQPTLALEEPRGGVQLMTKRTDTFRKTTRHSP
jgi:hypothetical protein